MRASMQWFLASLASLAVSQGVLAQSGRDYCQLSPAHTMCQFPGLGASCTGTLQLGRGVTEAEKRTIVGLHNKLRSTVANGQELRGAPGPQPPASDMLEMVWDEELAAVAQRWADQCQFGHDQVRDVGRFKVGQNVYISGSTTDGPIDWNKGILSWYDEVATFGQQGVGSYRFAPSTGHYTQMVWSKTNAIGCGAVKYRGGGFINQYLVCNYGPSGNFLRAPVYQVGQTCSRCPTGSVCADGLCRVPSSGAQPLLPQPSPQPLPQPQPQPQGGSSVLFQTQQPQFPLFGTFQPVAVTRPPDLQGHPAPAPAGVFQPAVFPSFLPQPGIVFRPFHATNPVRPALINGIVPFVNRMRFPVIG